MTTRYMLIKTSGTLAIPVGTAGLGETLAVLAAALPVEQLCYGADRRYVPSEETLCATTVAGNEVLTEEAEATAAREADDVARKEVHAKWERERLEHEAASAKAATTL